MPIIGARNLMRVSSRALDGGVPLRIALLTWESLHTIAVGCVLKKSTFGAGVEWQEGKYVLCSSTWVYVFACARHQLETKHGQRNIPSPLRQKRRVRMLADLAASLLAASLSVHGSLPFSISSYFNLFFEVGLRVEG